MPIDRERERMVKEGVAYLRTHAADVLGDDGIRVESLAESLALLAAKARAAAADEALHAEIVLRSCDFDRGSLREARLLLAALGYDKIAAVIRRLERTAPRRLTWIEHMTLKAERRGRLLN